MKSTSKKSCCTKDTPSCCESAGSAKSIRLKVSPAGTDKFQEYLGSVMSAGAINLKNKKLMALALSVCTKCEPCIRINADAAKAAGASDREISEAVAMGIAFGGAPVAMFYNKLRG